MIKLRLLLLMSLVLCPQKNSLHILAIGRETRLIHSLMEYAQQFSPRTFQASTTVPLTGKVVFDKHTWAPYFLHCGSLLLSSGGVCFVGDLCNWKKTRKDQLQAILTSNKIIFDFATKVSAGLSQQLCFTLECQVWGLYDPTNKSVKTSSSKDHILGGSDTGDLTKSFTDAFSYACFLDSGDSTTEQEIFTQVTCHILSSWCKQENDADASLSVSKEDFEHFLAISRQVEVRMSSEAESLIQSYYTASRTARSSGLCGSDVPPSALFTLTSLSVGFAKLKLQPFVSKCDALMAVFLYEESLAARFGVSMLNIYPQPHVPNSSIDDFLGIENDTVMQHFHEQLLRFCSCFTDNYSLHREE
ncbi:unnamed protein product [Candidula unifasciata]|uniref:MCM C-terminal AAA(+) ATPase domain-containing protein n=1 Tax=Candidula unifasciata TaxID=100452 RepID=A0A8S3ZU52_9EUPU|nr:unnamed protein product [Candidula unifasciata]